MLAALKNRQLNGSFTAAEEKLLGGIVEDKFFKLKKCSYTSVKLDDIQTKSVFAVAFSHDGQLIASTHADHTIRVLNYEPFGLSHTLQGHVRSPTCLQFHPRDRFILASGCLGGQVFLWNLKSMKGIRMVQKSIASNEMVHAPIGSLAFHPQGEQILASRSNQLTLWDIKTCSPLQSVLEPIQTVFTRYDTELIRGLLFDPFGRFLVTSIKRVKIPDPPLPQVKVENESWAPKRGAGSLMSLREARMRLLQTGQKRTSAESSGGSSTAGPSRAPPPPPRTQSAASSTSSARMQTSRGARPQAGVHTPQPRLETEPANRNHIIERELYPLDAPEGLQTSRTLCTNCQAGEFSRYIVQYWEYNSQLPDLPDRSQGIISESAIMVTNVNFEISKDGSFVCLVEKEECPESRGALLYLCVYSLLPENFRTCLMRTCTQYIPMSISITPHNQYIVVFARHTDYSTSRDQLTGFIRTYEVPSSKVSEKRRMTRSMTKPPSATPKFNTIGLLQNAMPINIAKFGMLGWQGAVIGTCTGKLYKMSIDPRQIS